MEPTYEAVAGIIKSSDSFIITSHLDPDGDSVGCQLAIYSILKRLGKSAKVIAEYPIPDTYHFLEGSSEVLTSPVEGFRTALVVDSASLDRLGWVKELVSKCAVIVNIDHHKSNDNFGHHNLVVTDAGACGEVIYWLSRAMAVELSCSEAEALYVAILSDTGCFRFPTTTSDTLRIAASLVDIGVHPYHAASEIFWKRSPAALQLLSSALSTIEISNGGGIAIMEVTQRMYEESGATARDSEGFANYPRSIRNVQVGVLLREIANGLFRVSLRSREGYAVGDLAKSFGGGGHPTAAGFRIEGESPDIKSRLRREIQSRVLNPDAASESS